MSIVKSGYLTKQGHVVKNWKRRWFVLIDNKLLYFKKPEDGVPKGVIELKDAEVLLEAQQIDGRSNIIKLVSLEKMFYFSAATQLDAKDWRNAIQQCIEYSVGSPFNVEHKLHIQHDPTLGFSGVPPEWDSKIQ